jgi:hypothetical protein
LSPRQGSLSLEIIKGISRDNGGFYNPQPIRKRKKKRLVFRSIDPGFDATSDNWATIMMQDVYNGLGDSVKRGSIKKLAIVQELEKPVGISPDLRAFGYQFPVVSCGATYAPKKIWGYATVVRCDLRSEKDLGVCNGCSGRVG